MNLEQKVRNMIKENGRVETRRKIQSFLSHLNGLILKSSMMRV